MAIVLKPGSCRGLSLRTPGEARPRPVRARSCSPFPWPHPAALPIEPCPVPDHNQGLRLSNISACNQVGTGPRQVNRTPASGGCSLSGHLPTPAQRGGNGHTAAEPAPLQPSCVWHIIVFLLVSSCCIAVLFCVVCVACHSLL